MPETVLSYSQLFPSDGATAKASDYAYGRYTSGNRDRNGAGPSEQFAEYGRTHERHRRRGSSERGQRAGARPSAENEAGGKKNQSKHADNGYAQRDQHRDVLGQFGA